MPRNMRGLDLGDTFAQVEPLPDGVDHQNEASDQSKDASDHQTLSKHESLHVGTPGTESGRGGAEIDCCRWQFLK